MSIEKRTITIKKCPLCTFSHTYSLELEVSQVWCHMTSPLPAPKMVSFVRLFSCPAKGSDYQATIRLQEDFSSPIEAVRVTGLTLAKNGRDS